MALESRLRTFERIRIVSTAFFTGRVTIGVLAASKNA